MTLILHSYLIIQFTSYHSRARGSALGLVTMGDNDNRCWRKFSGVLVHVEFSFHLFFVLANVREKTDSMKFSRELSTMKGLLTKTKEKMSFERSGRKRNKKKKL